MTGRPAGRAPFAGAVLCGGESRRMGVDKALLRVDGAPMAVRVADALRAAGAAEVRAVGGDPEAFASWGLPGVPDEHPGSGPLAATVTALGTAAHDVVVVLACDLLRPDALAIGEVVDALGRAPEGVVGAVPLVEGHHQWLHAAWRRRGAHAALLAQWASGVRSLRRAAAAMPIVDVTGIPATSTADADAPHDLTRDGVARPGER